MRVRLWALVALVSLVLLPSAAWADKRVALLIGNASYTAVGKLANPASDVALMKAAFERAGFDKVDTALDLTRESMVRTLRAFEDESADADIAVIYYSGHGMEMGGENYLVPIDATLKSDRDVSDEAITLDRVMQSVDGARRLKLVILDACRDNPFLAQMTIKSGKTRSVTRGLARVEPSTANTLIAFAAKGGTVALDGSGQNSPFAVALAQRLVEPGTEVEFALREVRDDVLKATGNRQEPFKYGSLGGDPIILVKQPATDDKRITAVEAADKTPPASGTPAGSECADAAAHWAEAQKFDRLDLYQTHLKFYGNCAYANFAKARIAELSKVATVAPAANPSSFDPTTLLPVKIEDADRTRFLNFDTTRQRTIEAALAGTTGEDAAGLAQVLEGERLVIKDDGDLLGNWRCRSAQLDDGSKAANGAGNAYVYPYFKCAITKKGGQLFFAKLNGSQRVSGYLYRVGGARFVFLGGSAMADDPPIAYGKAADTNVAAYLFKVGAKRLRLEIPNTCCSDLEILELVR